VRVLIRRAHDVAVQVAFERQTLKPVFHLIGYRLWVYKTIGYGLCVNLIQPAPPHHEARQVHRAVAVEHVEIVEQKL
jgi:hypothetical protein